MRGSNCFNSTLNIYIALNVLTHKHTRNEDINVLKRTPSGGKICTVPPV